MSVQEQGVYWPFKSLLTGSGITLVETPTSITIGTTGAGPGGGDMLSSVYATNGQPGVVDKALSVVGTIAHASLADTVPWGGIIGVPTSFPSDWGSITNKPAAFLPLAHAPTHITGGSDVIPVATTTVAGLAGILSGRVTDFRAGDGNFRDLNTQVGANPLTMQALLTANAGEIISGSGLVVNSGGATITGPVNLTTGPWIINNPQGWCGFINATSATWAAGIAFADGADTAHDSCVIARGAGGVKFLSELYYDTTGAQIYNAEILNTYGPNGQYSFRPTVQLIASANLPGNNTAWQLAPFVASTSVNGGFVGFGMVSSGYWGCCIGAWQSGVWIATSANTFTQLTNTAGQIVPGAIAAGTLNGAFTFTDGLTVDNLLNCGQLGVGAGAYIAGGLSIASGNLTVANQGIFTLENGLNASSYANAPIRIQCNGAGARAGVGFWNNGQASAAYLYWEGATGKFCFIDSGGRNHVITSS